MVGYGVGASLDEGQDQGSVAGQKHVEEGHRRDFDAIRERQFDNRPRVREQRLTKHVVIDVPVRFVAQEQLIRLWNPVSRAMPTGIAVRNPAQRHSTLRDSW
jgi:hypothetical protein